MGSAGRSTCSCSLRSPMRSENVLIRSRPGEVCPSSIARRNRLSAPDEEIRSAIRSPSSSVHASPARVERRPLRSGFSPTSSTHASPARFGMSPIRDRESRFPENCGVQQKTILASCRNRSESEGRNPIVFAVRAFGSCFRPQRRRSSSMEGYPDGSKSSSLFQMTSPAPSYGNFPGREWKLSGLYGRRNNPCKQNSGKMVFTMEEIIRATGKFSSSSKVGQGGFGAVYKGKLDDGTVVAVKRAKKGSYQNHINKEFQSEIQMLAQVEHLNLVSFFGYLEDKDEKVIVVEYVPSGTLREHLDCLHGKPLTFSVRLDIAIDVAHAVTYLHMYTDHPIIHRDIKSSNVLLTENHRAKVADFGFARLGSNQVEVSHVSTEVRGTAGYLDPEYLKTCQLTAKSDVYSFGVLLVELVSGRRPIETERELQERVTTRWAMKNLASGLSVRTLDPNLVPSPAAEVAVEDILVLASQCLTTTRHGRPSMRRCAETLWRIRKNYTELSSSDRQSSPQLSYSGSSSTGLISGSIPL